MIYSELKLLKLETNSIEYCSLDVIYNTCNYVHYETNA